MAHTGLLSNTSGDGACAVADLPFVENDPKDIRRSVAFYGAVQLKTPISNVEEFLALLRQLGPLMFTDGEAPVEGFEDLNIVSNVGRATPPKSVFHSDTSYVKQPPSYSALLGVRVPQSGGATLFTDQYAAAETLPKDLREDLRGAQVLHGATGVNDDTETWQPLFRLHPETKRFALYLSSLGRMKRLRLKNTMDASHLLGKLYQHSTQDHLTYRHQWSEGDVVIWDNRCTLHAADHSDVVGDRVLYRGLVRGEVPLWR
ncbi:MAG: TauD/TfdA family dioxygenase [Pseudomonadota bacterium]